MQESLSLSIIFSLKKTNKQQKKSKKKKTNLLFDSYILPHPILFLFLFLQKNSPTVSLLYVSRTRFAEAFVSPILTGVSADLTRCPHASLRALGAVHPLFPETVFLSVSFLVFFIPHCSSLVLEAPPLSKCGKLQDPRAQFSTLPYLSVLIYYPQGLAKHVFPGEPQFDRCSPDLSPEPQTHLFNFHLDISA